MKIEDMKSYLDNKKDNIKDGAKKAVATGLVVSALMGGTAMVATNLPKNPGKLSSEETMDVLDQRLKQFSENFDYDYLRVMVDHMEFVDQNKDDEDQILYYAIDAKDYNKMFTYRQFDENINKINYNNNVFTIKKDFLDDESMRDVLNMIYKYVIIQQTKVNSFLQPDPPPAPQPNPRPTSSQVSQNETETSDDSEMTK